MWVGSWSPPSAPTISTAPAASEHLPPESAYFLAVNRNKRSMTVNFKTPEGLDIIRKLVERSDVLVENFVSGKLASMGLGWEDCRKINERLIYASVTGSSLFIFLELCPTLILILFYFIRLWSDRTIQDCCGLRCDYRR